MDVERIARIKLVITQAEYRALLAAASQSLRTPEAEARFILRREFERAGLLEREKGSSLSLSDGRQVSDGNADRRPDSTRDEVDADEK